MVMEYCNGLMVDIMKDNLRMENNMVKELMFGRVKSILDNGHMVFRMVKEPIQINKVQIEKVDGRKGREQNGMIMIVVLKVQNNHFELQFYFKMSTQAPTTNSIITKVEIGRFTIYLVSLMVAVLMQMQMGNQATMNTSVKNTIFSGIENIFPENNQTRYSLLSWVDQKLYKGYSLNQNSTSMYSKLIPITFLELQTKYIKVDTLVNVWEKDLTEDKAAQGFQQQYQYPFIQRFPPYPVFKNISSLDDITGISFHSLKLIENGYLTSTTRSLTAKASYYSPNLQMICVVRIDMQFSAAGLAQQSIQYDSFRLSFYQNQQDYIRMVFEIIFSMIYINYLYMEGYKIYFKIQIALKDDETKQEALKKKENRKKQKTQTKKRGAIVQQADGEIDRLDVQGEQKTEEKGGLEKIQEEARRKTQIVINVLIAHISDIWSAIDVLILVLLGIAVSEYLTAIISIPYEKDLNEVLTTSQKYEDIFVNVYQNTLKSQTVEYELNNQFAEQADSLRLYRRFCGVALLIMWLKMLKYFINMFKKLLQYLEIMLSVLEYMIFYLVLLSAILISFSLFFYFEYGSQVFITATIGRSLAFILGFMIAENDQFDQFFEYDEVITFIMTLVYYVIVVIILCNMFFVFVKSEYNDYQKKQEKQEQKVGQSKKHDEVVKYLHPYWYFYNIIEYFVMRFWFTCKLQPSKFDEYNENKELQYVINEREFKENPQTIDFNIDFANLINQSVDDEKNSKFLIEEEKERILSKKKMELIKLIWKTVLLLVILSLNFILLQEFASPADSYLQSDSISRKIQYDRSNSQKLFKNLNTLYDMTDWLINGFPDLFDDNLLGAHEIKILQGISGQNITNKDPKKFINENYAFDNLTRANSLNTFNIIVNNIIRVTIRRSLMVNNTLEQFSILAPQTMLLFINDPLDDIDSEYENYETFDDTESQFVIEYDKTNGYGGYGGLVMLLEPKQLNSIINFLNQHQFMDTVSSLMIQFVTFNPLNSRGLAHIQIGFTINQCGVLSNKIVEIQGFNKNSLQSLREVSILILSVSLIIALCYYLYITIKTMLHKNFSYDRWYNTYILLSLNKSQLYIRERHMPEFIRKSLFLMDISQLLNLLFLTLLGAQITLILYYFFQVNGLVSIAKIYDIPINNLLSSTLFQTNQELDNFTFFSQISDIGFNSKLISVFGSCAILVLCLEILYLLSHNKDFQTLTNSIKYTVFNLPFILIMLFGIIVAFASMAHLVLGTDYIQFSTFFGTIVKMVDYINSLSDVQVFRQDDRVLEFYVMIIPYTFTVRFIIMNLFFALTLRGYLLSKEKQNEDQQNMKTPALSLTPQEFVLLSIKMFTFKEKLIKVGSDQYLMQIIKQFQPIKVYSSIKDNIRNQTNLTAMKTWAEECAKEIKDEKEIRKPLDVACHELLQAYIDKNNKGEFDILQSLNADPKRKLIEFSLKLTYINYFRFSIDQLDKFTVFFTKKREQSRQILFSDSKGEDYKKMVYISSLEAQLEENIQSMTFIKQELLELGFDIGEAGEIDSKENVIKHKLMQKQKSKVSFQNPLSNQMFAISKQKSNNNQPKIQEVDEQPDQDNQFVESKIVAEQAQPQSIVQPQTDLKDNQQGETTEKSTDEKPKSENPTGSEEQKKEKVQVKKLMFGALKKN